MDNPYKEICDKLGNPIDALDVRLSLYMQQHPNDPDLQAMETIIEDLKIRVYELRQKGYDIDDKHNENQHDFITRND